MLDEHKQLNLPFTLLLLDFSKSLENYNIKKLC